MFLEISEFAKVELCLGWVVFKGRCMKVFLIPICGAWRVKLDVILQQEELSWFKKSRAQWLMDRDRNTYYYHSKMISRRCRNRILMIWDDDGHWINEDKNQNSSELFLQKSFCWSTWGGSLGLNSIFFPNYWSRGHGNSEFSFGPWWSAKWSLWHETLEGPWS